MELLGDRFLILPKQSPRKGGMAEVYKALDTNTDQTVAIKLFSSHLSFGAAYAESFQRELRSLDRLQHQNIVQLLDFGDTPDGRRFLALEWMERSLNDCIASGPLDGWDSFYETYGKSILDALCFAYSKSIIHRDVKPHNILLTADGIPKLADFGLAKIKDLANPGATVAAFRSVPYCPPEPDDGLHSDTRDVYGFAALAVACLSEITLESHDDLYKALDRFDGPGEIGYALEKALNRTPTNRQFNILELRSDINRYRSAKQATKLSSISPICYISIPPSTRELAARRFEFEQQDLISKILTDLGDSPAFKLDETQNSVNSKVLLRIFGEQYAYKALVDHQGTVITLSDIYQPRPSSLDFLREYSLQVQVRFEYLPPQVSIGHNSNFISDLLIRLEENEQHLAEKRQASATDEVFKKWNSILQAKLEVDTGRQAPIKYTSYRFEGKNRILFFTPEDLSEGIIGQARLIESGKKVLVQGEVEDVGDQCLVLWCEGTLPTSLPPIGSLVLDTRASRQAIARQRQALDAIRFGRAANPKLRDYLVNPRLVPPPNDPGTINFTQHDLDESKQIAVGKALGSDAVLVIEGPPGTGKTKLISEIVLQELRRNPLARIFLSSQTHVALDNALDRISRLDPSLRLVRIGKKADPRISPEVEDLLLENRVQAWIEIVRQRSIEFLDTHAQQAGIDSMEIKVGMAAAKLAVSIEEFEHLSQELIRTRARREELETLDQAREQNASSDTFHALKEQLAEINETERRQEFELSILKKKVNESRKSLSTVAQGESLSTLAPPDLHEWADAFLNSNEDTRAVSQLFKLSEEWQLRFGKARDFYGAVIADSQMVAGTCLGYGGIRGLEHITFDLCIVDEASKATPTEMMVPMSRAKRWILVGDRRQLPSFVDDALNNKQLLDTHRLNEDDLKESLLEKLADAMPDASVTRLVHQHRMTRQIGDLISQCFYEGSLISRETVKSDFLSPVLPKPVTWISTSSLSGRYEQSSQNSFINLAEIQAISQLVGRINYLARARKRRFSVLVLSGYASQREALRRTLDQAKADLECLDIECNTVDALQGREADIAIYSATRSNAHGKIGFIRDTRRLNVALSRAKFGLAIVGDADFLQAVNGSNPWARVIDYIQNHPADCAFERLEK